MEPNPLKPCLRVNCSWCRLWKKGRGRKRGTDGKDQNRKIHKRSCGWQMRPRQAMSYSYYSRKKRLSKQVPASGLARWSISICCSEALLLYRWTLSCSNNSQSGWKLGRIYCQTSFWLVSPLWSDVPDRVSCMPGHVKIFTKSQLVNCELNF